MNTLSLSTKVKYIVLLQPPDLTDVWVDLPRVR